MKKFFLLSAAFLFSIVPASAEVLTSEVATSYSTVIGEWTYITNAKEFMLLVSECQDPYVEEKKVRLACDIEYPSNLSYTNNANFFIKYFRGVFDGMGFKITNFNLTSNQEIHAAFVSQLLGNGSEVCNLQFDNPNVQIMSEGTGAIVVNTVEGANCSIYNIYVNGGKITAFPKSSALGGIACYVNRNTSIHHCAIIGVGSSSGVYSNSENYTVGIFCYGLKEGVSEKKHGCTITDCYMTNISPSKMMAFSVPDPGDHCYYSNTNIPVDSKFTNFTGKNVQETTDEELKSGNSVLGLGWKYSENAMPEPEGLYYWKPSQTYNLNVGTYGSSQNLAGSVVPIEYGHFQDRTRLKLTSITPASSSTSYVISDNYTNEFEIENPITAIASDVFEGIPMTTLQLPRGVTTVEGTAFRHGVTEGFISNGNWHFSGNLLYLTTDDERLLLTSVGNNEELTINCQYCSSILDEALKGQEKLTKLYVNTWFPVGTTEFKPVELLGDNVFKKPLNELTDLTVYVKDGTKDQIIIGSNIEEGYKDYRGKWGNFYKQWADEGNRLIQYFSVTRNPAGLSTLVLGFTVKLPADCWAWVATGISDNKLLLKRVGHIVPANLPVLLSYENKEGIMHLAPYEGTDVPASTQYDTENLLFKGSLDPGGQKTTPSEEQANFLTLQLHPSYPTAWDKVGFYRFTGDVLPSYVAWIPMSELPANAHLAMVFDGDYEFANPTGVTDVAGQADNASAPVYNLSGQRVGSGYRGMVIKNGRKYIAK